MGKGMWITCCLYRPCPVTYCHFFGKGKIVAVAVALYIEVQRKGECMHNKIDTIKSQ